MYMYKYIQTATIRVDPDPRLEVPFVRAVDAVCRDSSYIANRFPVTGASCLSLYIHTYVLNSTYIARLICIQLQNLQFIRSLLVTRHYQSMWAVRMAIVLP